jgi:uncharacterized protein (TIGR03435 family)
VPRPYDDGMASRWKELLLTVLLAAAGAAQTALPRKLEFEVASVKPTAIDSDTWTRQLRAGALKVGKRINGDRAEYTFMTLRQLIVDAYQVRSFQVVGADRLPTGRFDVVGKMPAGSRKEDAPLMLQSLLADRFKLVVHRESREQGVAALVVGKGGPKLKESPPEEPLKPGDTKGAAPEGAGQTAPGKKDASATMTLGTVGYHFTVDLANSSFHLEASRMTMGDLAELLMKADAGNGRAVVDMTGLKGNYEVILDIPIAAVEGIAATGADIANDAQGPRPAEAASDPGSGRMLRSLKSLGLELENRKAPVEQLIVDHVEKTPTEN